MSNSSPVEVAVAIYPGLEGVEQWEDLPTTIAELKDVEKHSSLLGSNYTEYTYEYTSKKDVTAGDDLLSINGIQIDYSDIKNVRLLKGKTLVTAFRSYKNLEDCDYIALTIDKNSILTDESTSNHNESVFYLYLIGHFGSIRRHYTVSTEDKKYKIDDKLSASRGDLETMYNKIKNNVADGHPEKYVLHDAIQLPGCLKIEGWKESGATTIEAGIEGNVENEGSSRGYQIGPYTSSKSKSEGTITAELDGSIADDSFTSKIKIVQVTEDSIFIDSDPVLNLDYSAIDRVLERNNGFTIEAGGTTYSVLGYLGRQSSPSPLGSPDLKEAITYMQKRVEEADKEDEDVSQNDIDPSEKLRELKSLYEDGILTDKEFENKKQEILDDF